MNTLDEELKHPLNSRMFTCPAQDKWTSFQLVDEMGEGQPYTGLAYEVVDTEGHTYKGKLDATGTGKVTVMAIIKTSAASKCQMGVTVPFTQAVPNKEITQ